MKDLRGLAEEMRLASDMSSPAGMANLLNEGAAAIVEMLDDQKLTIEDLIAQAALDRCLKWTYDSYPTYEEWLDRAAEMAYDVAGAMMRRRKQ